MNQAGSTWDDIGRINVGIRNAAANIGVDERVILGIIMQESHGMYNNIWPLNPQLPFLEMSLDLLFHVPLFLYTRAF